MTLELLPGAGAPETHLHDLYRVALLAHQTAWLRHEPHAVLSRLRAEMDLAYATWRLAAQSEPSTPSEGRQAEMRYEDAVDAFIESLQRDDLVHACDAWAVACG